MAKKWPLGQLFQREGNDLEDEYKVLSAMEAGEQEAPKKAAEPAPMQEAGDTVYFAEIKGALLGVWEKWTGDPIPPTLKMTGKLGAAALGFDVSHFERERVRLMVQLEKDAKKRLQDIENAEKREDPSLDAKCQIYISRDKMIAWVFFFPPMGPNGQAEASSLGKALQTAGVTTGIDSTAVVEIIQDKQFFDLIPIAIGTLPVEGKNGEIIELFTREIPLQVKVDDDGMADYRAINYVRQVSEGDHICTIIPPKPGTPGVQVDGRVVEPRPVKPARPPRGVNTAISEDGRHMIASRDGHLEFANNAFHVRPVLEIKGDVDYGTGNIDFNGDIHIYGDVREGFEVRATGTIIINGLVEAATVEAGKDLIISRGVVGDQRAMVRSKGCVRSKYLENCVVYAGKTVYADCIMTSQIFSDDSIEVMTGRGSIIGGIMTAAHTIKAQMIGAQSGRRTELKLGVLPYVQTELQSLEEDLESVRSELERLERNLEYLEGQLGQELMADPRLTRIRMRKSMLSMQEKKLVMRQEELKPMHPELSVCRLECSTVYPVTILTVQDQIWVAREIRHRCRVRFDEKTGELKEYL